MSGNLGVVQYDGGDGHWMNSLSQVGAGGGAELPGVKALKQERELPPDGQFDVLLDLFNVIKNIILELKYFILVSHGFCVHLTST